MRSVAGAVEVHHAVEAGEGRPIALVSMAVELLLGEDVPTVLFAAVHRQLLLAIQGEGSNRRS